MENKKNLEDFIVVENQRLSGVYSLIKLTPESGNKIHNIVPGQFVQVLPPDNATYLRRPISVCFVDYSANHLWLLVRNAGQGTKAINSINTGERMNIIYPLGNGFTVKSAEANKSRYLLIGGGVGVAPLLFLGKYLSASGVKPTFLLGARTGSDLLLLEEFEKYGSTVISTEDGSIGEKGLVTENSIIKNDYDTIYSCGPIPMMKAVATIARQKGCDCEVSLENVMGCGIGACLCCVEKTVEGNLCVCSEGPVFNIKRLLWQD